MNNSRKKIILALETGISNGSLAIYDNDLKLEVACLVGRNTISKAEDLLDSLGELMNKHRINRSDIAAVVFGKDFGSLTGIKIGEATAKGLAKSFYCSYYSYSIWEILASIASQDATEKVFYLPAGKNRIAKRKWSAGTFFDEIEQINENSMNREMQRMTNNTVVYLSEEIYKTIDFSAKKKTNNLGNNFATHIAKYASDNE